jgi:hypothetical protein
MRDKVIITYYDVEQNIAGEILWIQKINDSEYQIKNIPFFAPNLAFDDIISVEDDGGNFYFEDIIKTSEHSTIQIVMLNDEKIKEVIKDLEDLNCSWEGIDNQTILAVDVPSLANYKIIKEYLEEKLQKNVLDYKEACLSKFHLSNLK